MNEHEYGYDIFKAPSPSVEENTERVEIRIVHKYCNTSHWTRSAKLHHNETKKPALDFSGAGFLVGLE